LAAAVLVSLATGPVRAGFNESAMATATDMATRILEDPGDFLFNCHLNNEDWRPIPGGRVAQIGSNLVPTIITIPPLGVPLGGLGLDGKVRVLREHSWWPQIDLRAGGWDWILLRALRSLNSTAYGFHGGLGMATTVDPRIRLFGGYQYTSLRAAIKLPDDINDNQDQTGMFKVTWPDEINAAVSEHFLYTGAELLRGPSSYMTVEVGYGVTRKKMVTRISWCHEAMDAGLTFYPESVYALLFSLSFMWRT
jgi:hypothetical protein